MYTEAAGSPTWQGQQWLKHKASRSGRGDGKTSWGVRRKPEAGSIHLLRAEEMAGSHRHDEFRLASYCLGSELVTSTFQLYALGIIT